MFMLSKGFIVYFKFLEKGTFICLASINKAKFIDGFYLKTIIADSEVRI